MLVAEQAHNDQKNSNARWIGRIAEELHYYRFLMLSI